MKQPRTGVDIRARFTVRDFLLLLSMCGVGGNLVWCWNHGEHINRIEQQIKPAAQKEQIYERKDTSIQRSRTRPI
jgi:hypothetical protein